MSYDIKIGKYKVKRLEKVVFDKRLNVVETAEITFPANAYNKALELEKKIKRGDEVQINLGYDEKNKSEFSGFVESITADERLKIQCTNASFLLRKEIENKSFKNITVVDVLEHVISADSRVSLSAETDLKKIGLDSFTVINTSGLELLKKLLKLVHLECFFENNTLIARFPYTGNGKIIHYDFEKNIEKSNLKFLKKEDKKVLIKAIGTDKKNKKTEVEVGEKGGDKITVNRYNISDKSVLEKIAQEELKKYAVDGYEGSFTAWLEPYLNQGDTVRMKDANDEEKNGMYYVVSVKTEFSANGGKRDIELGVKLG
jgi:hypothetical protein